jgi:hypothetical protein
MTMTLPQTLPCPFEGISGAQIERGPRKGLCSYPAELMDSTVVPPYYRCPLHGTLPEHGQDQVQ